MTHALLHALPLRNADSEQSRPEHVHRHWYPHPPLRTTMGFVGRHPSQEHGSVYTSRGPRHHYYCRHVGISIQQGVSLGFASCSSFLRRSERTSVLTNELLHDVQGKSGGMAQELQAIFSDSDASRISITPTVSRWSH